MNDLYQKFKSNLGRLSGNSDLGFVFGLFGRIPRSGEAIAHENLKFRVEKMKGARILNLHLTVINKTTNNVQEKVEAEI